LKKILGEVKLHPIAVADKQLSIEKARSPGLRHRHYAPKADIIVVEGALSVVVAKIKELAEASRREGKRVGILATDETVAFYRADVVKSLGSRNDFVVIAKNLFRLLREFDSEGVDIIIAEGVPLEGLGLAVMNRLRKASGYNIIKVGDR